MDEVNPLKGKPQGCRRDETSPTGVQARREEGVRATDEPWTCCIIEWFCSRKGAGALHSKEHKVTDQAARMATSANPIARKGHGRARNFERNRGMGPAAGRSRHARASKGKRTSRRHVASGKAQQCVRTGEYRQLAPTSGEVERKVRTVRRYTGHWPYSAQVDCGKPHAPGVAAKVEEGGSTRWDPTRRPMSSVRATTRSRVI